MHPCRAPNQLRQNESTNALVQGHYTESTGSHCGSFQSQRMQIDLLLANFFEKAHSSAGQSRNAKTNTGFIWLIITIMQEIVATRDL